MHCAMALACPAATPSGPCRNSRHVFSYLSSVQACSAEQGLAEPVVGLFITGGALAGSAAQQVCRSSLSTHWCAPQQKPLVA